MKCNPDNDDVIQYIPYLEMSHKSLEDEALYHS